MCAWAPENIRDKMILVQNDYGNVCIKEKFSDIEFATQAPECCWNVCIKTSRIKQLTQRWIKCTIIVLIAVCVQM